MKNSVASKLYFQAMIRFKNISLHQIGDNQWSKTQNIYFLGILGNIRIK